jgi:hypothetical protein
MAEPKTDRPGVFIAQVTFVADVDGVEHYVRTGDKVLAAHPVAIAHPENFRLANATD